VFFRFPEDARWNEDRQAVEFGIGVGEYEGVVRVPRQVFRRFIDGGVTPERCLEAYHLQRTRFELVGERKLRSRQLADDGNVEINGRDLSSSTKSSSERGPPLSVAAQARSRSGLPKGRREIA
jgi:Protein of unknown function (DUF1488)